MKQPIMVIYYKLKKKKHSFLFHKKIASPLPHSYFKMMRETSSKISHITRTIILYLHILCILTEWKCSLYFFQFLFDSWISNLGVILMRNIFWFGRFLARIDFWLVNGVRESRPNQAMKIELRRVFFRSWSFQKLKSFDHINFIYSEKATKICKIFTLLLTGTT